MDVLGGGSGQVIPGVKVQSQRKWGFEMIYSDIIIGVLYILSPLGMAQSKSHK
jgi:hypothetical protein